MNIVDRINLEFKDLSKGQKQIAGYILHNYEKAAYMTAATLAATVGVSESTVVRFAYALGYEGYPELQKDFQEVIKNKLTNVQRLEQMEGLTSKEILDAAFKMDVNNIKATQGLISPELMDRVVDSILAARTVYVLGTRASEPLARFLAYYMSYIISDVKMINFGLSDIYSQALYAGEKDLVIGISFPRYSLITVEGLGYFKSKGCKVVTITDNETAPPAQYSDFSLITKSNMNSFVDSLVAPLSLINVLIILLGLRKKNELVANFENLEKIWYTQPIYATQELEDKFLELGNT